MKTYAVTAWLSDGRKVKFTQRRGAGSDFSDLITGPLKSDCARQLIAPGYSDEEARGAQFKAVELP